MKPFLTVARHTIQILLILLTLGTALFLVWHALTFVLPGELVGKVEAGARRSMGLSEYRLLPNERYLVNSADAIGDHIAVMHWFSRCVRPPAGADLPSEVINLVTLHPVPGRVTGQNAPVFRVESTYLRTLTLSHDRLRRPQRPRRTLCQRRRGLQRFHGDIIKATWNWNCAASPPDANRVLDEWTQRMQGLLSEASDGRGPQGNANGGGGAGGPAPH